jgi:hypothetical protein
MLFLPRRQGSLQQAAINQHYDHPNKLYNRNITIRGQ